MITSVASSTSLPMTRGVGDLGVDELHVGRRDAARDGHLLDHVDELALLEVAGTGIAGGDGESGTAAGADEEAADGRPRREVHESAGDEDLGHDQGDEHPVVRVRVRRPERLEGGTQIGNGHHQVDDVGSDHEDEEHQRRHHHGQGDPHRQHRQPGCHGVSAASAAVPSLGASEVLAIDRTRQRPVLRHAHRSGAVAVVPLDACTDPKVGRAARSCKVRNWAACEASVWWAPRLY